MECQLPGCTTPVSAPSSVACGELHHMLLMASRYLSSTAVTRSSPTSCQEAEPAQAAEDASLLKQQHKLLLHFLSPESARLCALPSCKKTPWPDHRWCSRSHYLQWLTNFCESLAPRQICSLPPCTRHVFVDLNATTGTIRVHLFCGWRHCQEYQMRVALGFIDPHPPVTLPEKGVLHSTELSAEDLVRALKEYASKRSVLPKGITVDEDFFRKHPWEVLQQSEGEFCLLIARGLYEENGSKRELRTKEDYHWEQQGRSSRSIVDNCRVSTRHFVYKKSQESKIRGSKTSDHSFSMTEWTVISGEHHQACKDYCIVKLTGQVSSLNEAHSDSI